MTSSEEKFIPFKFFDNPDRNIIEVYCRGVENGSFKMFTLKRNSWIIVDPFRYPSESEDEKILSLQDIFGTVSVFHNPCDRYLIKNSKPADLEENDFKYISFLPQSYTIEIIMSNKRFYNLFSEDGDWTEKRGTRYKNIQEHHLLVRYNQDGNLECKTPHEDRYHVLDKQNWPLFSDNTDIIFTTIKKETFENLLDIKLENSVDYAKISNRWIPEDVSLHKWYLENISSIYELSFLSSRNISDIVCIDTRKGWECITSDIMLSISIPLFEASKVKRIPRNYAVPGKYNNIYAYRIGDLLLKLMEESDCKSTVGIFSKFSNLSRWSSIIANVFACEKLNPLEFIIPDSCVYIDNEYIMTKLPLEELKPVNTLEYIIIMAEGSYITFDSLTKKSYFHGQHPLCNPMFMAGKRCIENYMLCSASNFDVKIEAISDLTDKNADSLKIMVRITPDNINKYERVLPTYIIDQFDRNEISEKEIPMWLGENINEYTTIYDPQTCIKTSNQYLVHLMFLLDKIR